MGIWAGWVGCMGGAVSCTGYTIGCAGGAGSCKDGADGTTVAGWDAGGLPSAMSNYIINCAIKVYNSNPNLYFGLINSD